jgi:RNA polymerase sigma-70 factor (ECF subfamily)
MPLASAERHSVTDRPVQPSEQGATSSGLLERARGHDQAAWHRLVDLYAPLIDRWCRRRGLGDADAADVRQEVLVAVAAGLASFERRKEGAFRCWLWTITRTRIIDQERKRGAVQAEGGTTAQERLAQAAAPLPTEPPQADEATDRDGLYRRALDLIRRDFEESTWLAFWRVVVEGRQAADVAAELALTRNAVYLAKARVLKRLRDEFRDLID